MTLPAREIPEEQPNRIGQQGAAGSSAETPSSADAGRGADAGPVTQADSPAQEAGKTALAEETAPTDAERAPADAEMAASSPPSAAPASLVKAGDADSAEAMAGREWSEVLAMFVDDPRGSVAEASVMVDEAINAFIATARGRQASLAALWQAQDTDTEQLRRTLRDYRTFWTSMAQLPQSA